MKKVIGLFLILASLLFFTSCEKNSVVIQIENSDGSTQKVKLSVTDDAEKVQYALDYIAQQSLKQLKLDGIKMNCDLKLAFLGGNLNFNATTKCDLTLSEKHGAEAHFDIALQQATPNEQNELTLENLKNHYDAYYLGSLNELPDENNYIYMNYITLEEERHLKCNTKMLLIYLYSKLQNESDTWSSMNGVFPNVAEIDTVEEFKRAYPNSSISISNLSTSYVQLSYSVSWLDLLNNLFDDESINDTWESNPYITSYFKNLPPLVFTMVHHLETGLLHLFEFHYDATEVLNLFSTSVVAFSKARLDLVLNFEYGDFAISDIPNMDYEDITDQLA